MLDVIFLGGSEELRQAQGGAGRNAAAAVDNFETNRHGPNPPAPFPRREGGARADKGISRISYVFPSGKVAGQIEHLLIGELLKYSWLHHGADLEISKPELDRAGHDIILEANRVTRHVQLKSSFRGARTARQMVHVDLAEKPSGCVIWVRFDPETLEMGPFLFFGSEPGEPLPPIEDFRVARHTKGNALGIKKERAKLRVVAKGQFRKVETIEGLYKILFGT